MGVPWNTSLRWCRQSRYWADAEASARSFLAQISLDDASRRGSLPIEMDDDRRNLKAEELVESAVSCWAYLYATSTPIKLALLTKAVLILFLHDDVVERDATKDDLTIGDQFLALEPRCKPLQDYFSNVLEADPARGPELLRAIRSFVRHGREKLIFDQSRYTQLVDYMEYRRMDVGKEFMLAAIRLSCGVDLSADELTPLEDLSDLYVRHSILINDLYSYDKERHEVECMNAGIVNAVAVVARLLSVTSLTAKGIVRSMTWDMERDFHTMCQGQLPHCNDRQVV